MKQALDMGGLKTPTVEEYIATRGKNLSSEDKAKHKRAYYVEKTRKALGNDFRTGEPYTFGKVNGLSKHLSVEELEARFIHCEKYGGDNFPKAWFGERKKDF